MRKIFLIFFVFYLTNFINASEICAPKLSLSNFKNILHETKIKYFPELENEKIIVKKFKSDAYFLRAQPIIKTLVRKKRNRVYSIQLNLNLLECPPPREGLVAILIHELEHVKDYTSWSSAKIIKHGIRYATSFKFMSNYEKETDIKALEKGVHVGLATYRQWVYQWLSPKDLEKKKNIYLTPDQILEL